MVVEADCMTPVDSYLIYIESSSVDNQVVEVPVNSNHVEHGPMIMHELILNVSGQYRVGVAARNGAGESDVTYFEKDLSKFNNILFLWLLVNVRNSTLGDQLCVHTS